MNTAFDTTLRKWQNHLVVPIEALRGRDLYEIQKDVIDKESTRRKTLEARFSTIPDLSVETINGQPKDSGSAVLQATLVQEPSQVDTVVEADDVQRNSALSLDDSGERGKVSFADTMAKADECKDPNDDSKGERGNGKDDTVTNRY